MSAQLKLVSVNIEIDRHLDAVQSFLRKENPDVACIQELPVSHIEYIAHAFNAPYHVYAPMTIWQDPRVVVGTCIFSKTPFLSMRTEYYRNSADTIQDLDYTSVEASNRTKSLPVVSAVVKKDGVLFQIATTHFTWTPDSKPDDYQRKDIRKLLALMEPLGEFVFTGDFNVPRGTEIFEILAHTYKDNIPSHYTTSIDGNLHRKGQLNIMVDGLFTTPEYQAKDVELHFGVSDHAAVTATISKK